MPTYENEWSPSAASGKLTSLPGTLKGYEAFHAVNETMVSQPFHCHDYYELYLHIRGGQLFGMDNDLFRLSPNELIILPPFSMHGILFEKNGTDYERAYLNLSPETLHTLGCGQIDLNDFFLSHTNRGHFRYQLTDEETQLCLDLIDHIQNYTGSDDPVAQYENYSKILCFLSTICNVVRRTPASTDKVTSGDVIRDVLSYINQHYTEQLKISDLAKRFNVSESLLSHGFAKFTNRSVYDYILYRRIMLAKEIINTETTLNSVAFQCGFNDYSNFLRMFTKIVGKSPAQYRKTLRHD